MSVYDNFVNQISTRKKAQAEKNAKPVKDLKQEVDQQLKEDAGTGATLDPSSQTE